MKWELLPERVVRRGKVAWEVEKINLWNYRSLLASIERRTYRSGMEHHVYFWLKEERENVPDRAALEKGIEALCTSPHIASFHWGGPAPTADRPVTDHSFAYALSLKFNSIEDHNRYQDGDPVHEEFIANFKSWWARVVVMDVA